MSATREEATEYVKIPSGDGERENWKRLIVVIEDANLQTIKVGGSKGASFALMNSDDHRAWLSRNNIDVNLARPDITHQCLLMLLDSPLNKAGMLQIFIRTNKNVLIEVNPHTRIPRTFKRFSGLMVQLLHKLSIRAANGPTKLLKVIKNPVTKYFPTGCRRIGTSTEGKMVKLGEYVASLPEDEPVVFVVGGIARGQVNPDYVTETIAISEFPLSAAGVCSKICTAFEAKWDVL
ncbi:uncharacterized protein AMSG_09151 [Thecamonas trahens ATCC 50062]|uniref:Ribosomal RNA small subunit methyltransferase NEP1 n=1 Tax=Thecamonas trahens ATCC 50062 TaxID=461836 RepID=A0A0L0DLQ7_THETB|nr:hypothetical protein AMSG_09151 [Thecamonas trahens ATCC 50062]KNC52976.1 hypothetical protein AMSG_09151 [Thecamonas trahens ATCC 50062]|eukprot:XP_013754866.1 hypothetical protein AMSG_09151 [Thecamonas trahens ATCC 50062]